jgi:cell division protein FtsB
VNLRRFVFVLFLLIFAGSGVAVGIFFIDTRDEYLRLKGIQTENLRHLNEAQARLQEQEKVLERLRTDPGYVERVIRLKLGYTKPDEQVFRFPDATAP